METPIFGPFYVSRSPNLAANRLMNLYPEVVETRQGKRAGALYQCPGLIPLTTVGNGPVQALYRMSGTLTPAVLWVVSGNVLYQLDQGFGITPIGSVAGGGPVKLTDNGTQLAVFAGSNGYVWSAALGLQPIALPFATSGAIAVAQQDGYGLINQPGSALWFQSNLLDLSVWQALNFGDASGDPDDVVTIAQLKREIWLIKEFDTEIWYNAGTPGFTFARLDGAYIEAGCVAPGSLARSVETLIWLAQNKSGGGVVVQSQGHAVQAISTHAIDEALRQYPGIADAIGYCYQQDGHEFYVLTFPSGDMTWVYDVTESALAGVPMWHERGAFDPTTGFHRHWSNCHAFFAGKNVVGDYRNGNLYAFDPGALDDNGTAMKRLRSWRALAQPSEKPVRFDMLRIDMQTGIAVPAGSDPQMILRWSDDGGHTWSNERQVEIGKTGETALRVMARRMGATRKATGLDRIFEISATDKFPWVIVGADLEAA